MNNTSTRMFAITSIALSPRNNNNRRPRKKKAVVVVNGRVRVADTASHHSNRSNTAPLRWIWYKTSRTALSTHYTSIAHALNTNTPPHRMPQGNFLYNQKINTMFISFFYNWLLSWSKSHFSSFSHSLPSNNCWASTVKRQAQRKFLPAHPINSRSQRKKKEN